MKRFASFSSSLKNGKEVSEDSFSTFRKKMKIAVKNNAIHRRKAIQSASKVILTQ